jgi:phosphoribosylformylglycinamidine synthase
MFLAKIFISLKPTVNDPQGLTVLAGLKDLSFKTIESVRVGKYIEVEVNDRHVHQAMNSIDEMCRQLLANPVIEDYRFELEELGGSGDHH